MRRTIFPGTPGATDPAFLEWLREHDIEPFDCAYVTLGRYSIVAEMYERGEDGKVRLVEGAEQRMSGWEAAVRYTVTRKVKTPCPIDWDAELAKRRAEQAKRRAERL